MFGLKVLFSAVILAVPALAFGPYGITKPTSGTAVQPGEAFDFEYDTLADYGVSSYNFTVWLFTSEPTSFAASDNFATGHYFGRYGLPNYPGNPYPPNEPPAQLVMPDFSARPGGFGAGATAENKEVYLVVIEEYATSPGTVGSRLALSYNPLVYNATGSA